MSISNITEAIGVLQTIAENLPSQILLDTTLALPNCAADAKAVGDILKNKADKTDIPDPEAIPIVTAQQSTSGYFTATVSGLTSLGASDKGKMLVIIPDSNYSSANEPYLNINDLGDFYIRFPAFFASSMGSTSKSGFTSLKANSPSLLIFNGYGWETVLARTTASALGDETFGGTMYANSSTQDPDKMLIRNSQLVSVNTSPSNNGEICWIYE